MTSDTTSGPDYREGVIGNDNVDAYAARSAIIEVGCNSDLYRIGIR